MENIINNNMDKKPTFTSDIKRLGKWVHLYMLKMEHDTIDKLFRPYEEKVINEEVDENSLTYKLWLKFIENRNCKVHRVIMNLEDELGIFD